MFTAIITTLLLILASCLHPLSIGLKPPRPGLCFGLHHPSWRHFLKAEPFYLICCY